jgi:hypothetical protein
MASTKKLDDQFSKREAKKRFEAALRGARVTGHKPKDDIPRKRGKKRKPTKGP